MEPPFNPRIDALVARWSQLPPELVEPIITNLPLHRVLELSLSPSATPVLIGAIENSPSWSWLFRHESNAFGEIRRLFKTVNDLAWLQRRNTQGQTEVVLRYFSLYRASSRPLSHSSNSRPINPVTQIRHDFLSLFLDLLPIPNRQTRLKGFTETTFRAVCIFLPDDIVRGIISSLTITDISTVASPSWSEYLARLPALEVIEKKAQTLLCHEWTHEKALQFVPYLIQAYQHFCEANAAELYRLIDMYEQYPSLLKCRFGPEKPPRNSKHIPDGLRGDAKRWLSRPLEPGRSRRRGPHHFRTAQTSLIPCDWCVRLYDIVVQKYPTALSSRYPDDLRVHLRRCLVNSPTKHIHSSAMPHSLSKLDWLESYVRCIEWMHANAANLGVDLRECGPPPADINPEVLLNPSGYEKFLAEETLEIIVKQIKSDIAICDDPVSTKLPSLLALYLPPFSTPRGREIANKLTPGFDIGTQRLLYEAIFDKLKLQVREFPLLGPHVNDHRLAFEADALELNGASSGSDRSASLEKLSGLAEGRSWQEVVHVYAASKIALNIKDKKLCYICRLVIHKAHKTFSSMCEPCGDFNLAGSDLSLPESLVLIGKVALVTGARVNLGYHTAMRLLRCGASVIASTRYPEDAFVRYQSEPDFDVWRGRLRIVGADFRAAADAFNLVHQTQAIVEQWGGRLDILINNAAQTLTDSIQKETNAIARESLLYEEGGPKSAIVQLPYTPRVRGLASANLNLAKVSDTDVPSINAGESNRSIATIGGHLDEVNIDLAPRVSTLQLKPEVMAPSSWVQSLSDIPYEDVITAQSVNSIVPLILVRELLPIMKETQKNGPKSTGRQQAAAYIVNVSSREGIFESKNTSSAKNGKHVHTNMSKAALNMITETEAHTAWKQGRVAMNTVDPGYMSAAPEFEKAHGGERPIGWEDGAGRVLWPVAIGEDESMEPVWGRFLKHYGASRVDVRWGRG